MDAPVSISDRSIGVIFLHPGCNMSCSFCITTDTYSSMRPDQAVHLLDVLRARGIDNVVMGGGEPTMWAHDLVGLTREAKERGFLVQLGTNGVAMPCDYERLDSIDRYVLPLDGPDAATHDRMRHCGASHFEIVRERMERLRDAGKCLTVSTVVTAENIDRLADLAVLLMDHVLDGARLHAWHLYRFIPEGREGARNAPRLDVPEAEYDAACAQVRDMGLGFTIYKRKDMRHSKTVDFFWYAGERIVVGSEVWARAKRKQSFECKCVLK